MANSTEYAPVFSAEDTQWMQRALELAHSGVGLASPNPTVGCVIVKNGDVIGEGFHRYEFRDHAEVVALKIGGEKARGSTAYVTLEPCSHTGRTPPCADALIAAGVKRIVAATLDPNPVVCGEGISRLRAAGVDATSGLLQSEARVLNNAFAKFIRTHLPFVTLKAALSRDGYLAPAEEKRAPKQSYRLTGPAANAVVQQMRHAADALMTGIGTVRADDPLLTDRSGVARRKNLIRAVMDSELRTPTDGRLASSAHGDVILFCGSGANDDRQRNLERVGVEVVRGKGPHPQPVEVLRELVRRGVIHVMLEAGSKINGAFLEADAVDELVFFYTPHMLGPGSVPFTNSQALMETLEGYEKKMVLTLHGKLAEDVMLRGLLRDPWQSL